jgi:ubiquitin-like 1-activating enzyme E1 A
MSSSTSNTKKPTESDIYDRQIRLWGAEAQAKISKAKVLYIHITGVSSEVLKNLVLAGVAASVCDNRTFPDVMVETPCFFLPPSSLVGADHNDNDDDDDNNNNETERDEGSKSKRMKYATVAEAIQPMIEDLNPLLGSCPIVTKQISELTAADLQEYSVVIASRLNDIQEAIRISKLTTEAGGIFYLTDCFGMNGACICDLGPNYRFRPEQGKNLLDETSLYTPKLAYVSLEDIWKTPLQDATNRFHKSPPPVWLQYRCLLEYVHQTHSWPTPETAGELSKLIQGWLSTSSTLKDSTHLSESALSKLANVATAEVAPVCSVLGGMIGNEVIKVISGKGEPATNTLLLDGTFCKAWTFLVEPK